MIEIILDASQLELIEPCPRKWYYAHSLNLVPKHSRRSFDLGSYYHEVLENYYKLTTPVEERLRPIIELAASPALLAKYHIYDKDEATFHRKRLIDYFLKWTDWDQSIKTIAVEQGFSYLLYEDVDRRYILEGKIDWVCEIPNWGLCVVDHKTQARFDNRWEFNHQVCNYLNFTKANYFFYNYIGLQDKLPAEGFRRVPYKPHPGMLAQWLYEVKLTFDEHYENLIEQTLYGETAFPAFPRHRSACDSSKYGLCQFHKLCSVPDGSPLVDIVKTAYKENDKRWRPWT